MVLKDCSLRTGQCLFKAITLLSEQNQVFEINTLFISQDVVFSEATEAHDCHGQYCHYVKWAVQFGFFSKVVWVWIMFFYELTLGYAFHNPCSMSCSCYF